MSLPNNNRNSNRYQYNVFNQRFPCNYHRVQRSKYPKLSKIIIFPKYFIFIFELFEGNFTSIYYFNTTNSTNFWNQKFVFNLIPINKNKTNCNRSFSCQKYSQCQKIKKINNEKPQINIYTKNENENNFSFISQKDFIKNIIDSKQIKHISMNKEKGIMININKSLEKITSEQMTLKDNSSNQYSLTSPIDEINNTICSFIKNKEIEIKKNVLETKSHESLDDYTIGFKNLIQISKDNIKDFTNSSNTLLQNNKISKDNFEEHSNNSKNLVKSNNNNKSQLYMPSKERGQLLQNKFPSDNKLKNKNKTSLNNSSIVFFEDPNKLELNISNKSTSYVKEMKKKSHSCQKNNKCAITLSSTKHKNMEKNLQNLFKLLDFEKNKMYKNPNNSFFMNLNETTKDSLENTKRKVIQDYSNDTIKKLQNKKKQNSINKNSENLINQNSSSMTHKTEKYKIKGKLEKISENNITKKNFPFETDSKNYSYKDILDVYYNSTKKKKIFFESSCEKVRKKLEFSEEKKKRVIKKNLQKNNDENFDNTLNSSFSEGNNHFSCFINGKINIKNMNKGNNNPIYPKILKHFNKKKFK